MKYFSRDKGLIGLALRADILHIQAHGLRHPELNLIAGKEGGAQFQGYIPNHGIDLASSGELDLVQVGPDAHVFQLDLARLGKLGELAQLLQASKTDISPVVGLGLQLRYHGFRHDDPAALQLTCFDLGRDSAINYHTGIWH